MMTWEQKFFALKAISPDAALRMRKPGNWFVSLPGAEIGGNGMLTGGSKNGDSPETAVLCAWDEFAECLPLDRVVVVGAMRPERRELRWNGFMWEDQ